MVSEEDWEEGEILEEGEKKVVGNENNLLNYCNVLNEIEMEEGEEENDEEGEIDEPLPQIQLQEQQPKRIEMTLRDLLSTDDDPSKNILENPSNRPPLHRSTTQHQNLRKRAHSQMESTPPSRSPSPSSSTNQAPKRHHGMQEYSNTTGTASSAGISNINTNGHTSRNYEEYDENWVLKFPRQRLSSQVLLDFSTWMSMQSSSSRHQRKRCLYIEDIQDILLKSVLTNTEDDATTRRISEFLSTPLFPSSPKAPTKVCVVLLENSHPAIIQKNLSLLSYFSNCTTMPCSLSKSSHPKPMEASLPELLFKFPRPPIDARMLSTQELFYEHELTFLMNHSAGWNDELVLQPWGDFFRKNQAQGGKWVLDGDLLHLKWRRQHQLGGDTVTTEDGAADAKENDEANYNVDVLVAEDNSMHFFKTDPITEKQYAREIPAHLQSSRNGRDTGPKCIRINLVRVVAIEPRDKPRESITSSGSSVSINGTSDPTLDLKTLQYYGLSKQELRSNSYPVDIGYEQQKLNYLTKGSSRDRFVQTQPRTDGDKLLVYGIDCEMCETDQGYELTRVTLVDINEQVVYDEIVKPQSTIINYHTEFSGITQEMIQNACLKLEDVQKQLMEKFIFQETWLVGHSLTSDLNALRLVHHRVIDTAILYPHPRGFPFKTSLKYLTKTFLNREIQNHANDGHDSAEDAIAAMQLFLLKVQNGPEFGLPFVSNKTSTYTSLVDKLQEQNKRISFFGYRLTSSSTTKDGEEVDLCLSPSKPWQVYASGRNKTYHTCALLHAQYLLEEAAALEYKQVSLTVDNLNDWKSLKTQISTQVPSSDFLWIEIQHASPLSVAEDFLYQHEAVWMQKQEKHLTQVNDFLEDLYTNILEKDTLLVVIPQGDLAILRHLKGLRTRARWQDTKETWTNEMQVALSDAFSDIIESVCFLALK
jgi:RNA exonuclease 1